MAKLNDVAVLDIGSKKISVMIGNKTPKGVFNVKGFGSCYYSGFSGGKWFNVQDLKSAVGKALHVAEAESGVKAKKLYIGVPSEFIAIVVKEVVLARGRAQRITDADVTELFEQGDTYKNHSRYTTIGNFAIYYTLDDKTRRFVEPRGIEAYKSRGSCRTFFAKGRSPRCLKTLQKICVLKKSNTFRRYGRKVCRYFRRTSVTAVSLSRTSDTLRQALPWCRATGW